MKIGIDVGGTKIELIALDDQGAAHMRFRRPTPVGDYKATVALIAEMVHQAEIDLGVISSVGIGTPGAISLQNGLMKNCNSTCLIGRPLKEDIEHVIKRQVRLTNDANCFALSEARDGAAAGCSVVFGVILGTGVGGGLVVNGQVLDGANHIAGEWGHNPLPVSSSDELPGPLCYCGRYGCIEAWLSGPAIHADHLRRSGHSMAAEAIVFAADGGDEVCRQTLSRYCDRLARALAIVINILDPDVIVLGGGMSNIAALYTQVPALWQAYIFSDEVRTKLLPPVHGDSSGVRGAAWLWGRQ
jgi:predicted NBD/HSP70 family sugar kinase